MDQVEEQDVTKKVPNYDQTIIQVISIFKRFLTLTTFATVTKKSHIDVCTYVLITTLHRGAMKNVCLKQIFVTGISFWIIE